MSKPEIWVSYGSTESGDTLPIFLWETEPSRKEVEALYRLQMPYEFDVEDGPGFVNFEIEEASWGRE